MFNFEVGRITNPKTGKKMNITVNALSKNNMFSILIGSAIILTGIVYMGASCFRNGAWAYDTAEWEVFKTLDLVKEESR